MGWSGLVVTFRDWKGGTIEEVGVIEGVEGTHGGSDKLPSLPLKQFQTYYA